jgi:Na+/proline symporter
MPWWVSMIIGALSVIFYDFFKRILKKCNMKPLLLRVCAFVLTIVLCAVVAGYLKKS